MIFCWLFPFLHNKLLHSWVISFLSLKYHYIEFLYYLIVLSVHTCKHQEIVKFVTCLQDLSKYNNQEVGVNLLFMSASVKVRSYLSEKGCVKYGLTHWKYFWLSLFNCTIHTKTILLQMCYNKLINKLH